MHIFISNECLHLQMRQYGYDGIFRQKSRESMGQYGKVDGCAVFWATTKVRFNSISDIIKWTMSLIFLRV